MRSIHKLILTALAALVVAGCSTPAQAKKVGPKEQKAAQEHARIMEALEKIERQIENPDLSSEERRKLRAVLARIGDAIRERAEKPDAKADADRERAQEREVARKKRDAERNAQREARRDRERERAVVRAERSRARAEAQRERGDAGRR